MECPRCGTEMEGGVCPNCGFPIIQNSPGPHKRIVIRRRKQA